MENTDFNQTPANHNALCILRDKKKHRSLTVDMHEVDSVVFNVMSEFKKRANVGMQKYGKDLDRDDLTFVEWIQHAKEEHMDAILYLEKIRQQEMDRMEGKKQEAKDCDHKISMLFKYFQVTLIVYIIVRLIFHTISMNIYMYNKSQM